MFSRNAHYYEWLPAYLEDELDPAQKGLMTARLAVDPALAAEAERMRPLLQALRESKAREASAPANSTVPGDLWLRLSDRLNPAPSPRPTRQYGWLAGIGATAALAVIVALRLPQSMPLETHPIAPVQQTIPGDQTRSRDVKIAKTNPPTTPNPLTINALKPMRPQPGAKPVPPTVSITNGGNDPFAAPSAPRSSNSTSAQPMTLPVPAPIPAPTSVARAAPVQHRADKVQVAGANDADRLHGSGEVNGIVGINVNGSRPAAPAAPMAAPTSTVNGQVEAPATSTAPAQRDMPMNAYQTQATSLDKLAVRPKVFRRTQAPAMDQSHAAAPSLEAQQTLLAAAMQPPLWGETDGMNQANQTLMTVRESGQLDTLRGKLEVAQSQSPQSLGTGRMLAAVYEFGFQSELTISERRRIVGLDGAGGEDWFALAVAEEQAGNGQGAKAAYHRALELPGTLNSFHASLARQRQ